MIFSLEVLQAGHGDCLILHYGENNNPNIIVIDGGPANIYKNCLKPRLLEIKEQLTQEKALPLSMVMVSHMDDDHVNGILDLTDEMIRTKDAAKPQAFKIKSLWFNAFDDIVGNSELPGIASVSSATAANINTIPIYNKIKDGHIKAIIASTGQGRKLRENALTLNVSVNTSFKALKGGAKLVRGEASKKPIDWTGGISINVIHPTAQRLIELQEQWDEDLKKAAAKGDPDIIVAALQNADRSPFNLSSIVCLVQFGKKTILLTGDARSDDIIKGLQEKNLLDEKGKLHVDVIKMPHHGSNRNMTETFLQNITADTYIISADGKHGNPDIDTIEGMAKVFAKRPATLYLTNHEGEDDLEKKLDDAMAAIKSGKQKLKIKFRKKSSNSIIINLGDKLDY